MRTILLALLLAAAPHARAAQVINVEFQFAPFTGDPATADEVETVPGTARVRLNGVPLADQAVEKRSVPVLFEEREIGTVVWVPVASLGTMVRKGKNHLRLEFVPTDPQQAYTAQLRWASVMDEATETQDAGRYAGTNMAGTGVDTRKSTGTVVFERDFTADFAKDVPWHHAPAITTVDDAERAALVASVTARAAGFTPDFAAVYAALQATPGVRVEAVRKAKCLDAAWKAGVRLTAPPADAVEVVTTGGPVVVVQRKDGAPLFAVDQKAFAKITDPEMQMCVEMALMAAYPPRLLLVRGPDGGWRQPE